MSLTTAYALPYAVLYGIEPIMSIGKHVRVVAALASAPSPAAVDALDSLLQPFVLLAQSGALAGSSIPPWMSTIADKSGPAIRGNSVQWLLQQSTTDERAIPMLAQMLVSVQETCHTKQLTIQRADDPMADHRLQFNRGELANYPGIFSNLPFELSRSYELSDEIVVSAVFCEDPSLPLRERVSGEIYAWAAGLVSGAYGVAPTQPDECIAVVDDPEWRRGEITVAITRFVAHPSAIDGLINVLAAIHERMAHISLVTVE